MDNLKCGKCGADKDVARFDRFNFCVRCAFFYDCDNVLENEKKDKKIG